MTCTTSQAPPKNTWNCDSINYEVHYTDEKGRTNTEIARGDQTRHTFDASPYTRYGVKIRTTNTAGASEWSSVESVKTLEGGENYFI